MADSDVSVDGVLCSDEDQNTKKVRFKEGVEKEIAVMAVDPDLSPKLTGKDMLLGEASRSEPDRNGSSEGRDNNFDFLEGNVSTDMVDGMPSIAFSERIKNILFKEMDLTIVLKLLGRNIGYNALHNRILSLWKPVKSFHLMDTVNGYFLVKFQDIAISQVVLAWILLQGLPGYLYNRKIIEVIGGLIGKVVKLDFQTDNRTRGRYGHTKELCPMVVADQSQGQPTNVVVEAQGDNRGRTGGDKRPDFGPWMLVERKVRLGQLGLQASGAEKSGNESFGFRFLALNQVGDLWSVLRAAVEDFTQETVKEREAVGVGSFKGRANESVSKKSGPYFEAGRGKISGSSKSSRPATVSSLDSLEANVLGQENNFNLDNFWRKRPMEMENNGENNKGPISNSNANISFFRFFFDEDANISFSFVHAERVKAHFNPAFEVSETVDIQISEGALDPGKHSAVSFKENIIVDQQAKSGDRDHGGVGEYSFYSKSSHKGTEDAGVADLHVAGDLVPQ
ncbi:hypothetical protein GOBAR_AA02950 [Gossypium barbadense]|uniref:Uncharacterized protein n=1 Tax=Gossypium barbadense TaxID=3634 RepID=A0A2P5YPU1_GOSBA|nr:hypothetical protein GOBAR_AA02950 [Gossypium barbadense]